MTKLAKRPGWKLTTALIGAAFVASAFAGQANAFDWSKNKTPDGRASGYIYSAPETQAVQDDDFENPGILWVENGEALWSKPGPNGKSCASCHADPAKDMKGVAATYPKYNPKSGKMEGLEQRINRERMEKTGAKDKLKYDSGKMLALNTFITFQSRGMPVNVQVDGEAKPFFEKGKAFYYQRRGQLDMACKHCHEDHPGENIRADHLSQGQANGFPAYRLKWQKVGSLHRRFRGCNKNIRAQPYKQGAPEYVNLELYLKWRGRGLKIESPAVRR